MIAIFDSQELSLNKLKGGIDIPNKDYKGLFRDPTFNEEDLSNELFKQESEKLAMELKMAQNAVSTRLAELKGENQRKNSRDPGDRLVGLTSCMREEFYIYRPTMKKRLLCRTCSSELDTLTDILRKNHIEAIPEVYIPKLVLEGSDLVLWNVYVVESDLKEAGRLLGDHGLAIWVHSLQSKNYP